MVDDSIDDFCHVVDQAIASAPRGGQRQSTVDVIVDAIALRVADPNRIDDAAALVLRNHGHND